MLFTRALKNGLRNVRWWRAVAVALLLLRCPVLEAQKTCGDEAARSPTAPTTSVDDPTLDCLWQNASSAYGQPRSHLLQQVDEGANRGAFRPDWQSLATYEVPEWYKDAKFGIFIHWGLYSVPAFGSEQYPQRMYHPGSKEYKHHLATYGSPDKFGYKDFIPMFKAEHYDPAAWARLFKEAGAKYVVPVFEHHDGFVMYDSDLSDWTAMQMGPHRDLAGDLAKAVRAEGLYLGASSHRIEHDWFMHTGRDIDADVNDPRYAAFYGPAHPQLALDPEADNFLEDWTYLSPVFASDWLARAAEVVDKYHPDLFYFDFWIGHTELRPYLARFAAYFYNETIQRGRLGVINYKLSAMHPHSAVLDVERGVMPGISSPYWQTDTSVGTKSWGYIRQDVYRTPESIVHELVDIVSKNGNLLLNVGPRADGTIPNEVQRILRQVGGWLRVNGEAIYGTRPWKTFGEGPTRVEAGPVHDAKTAPYTAHDFRFTKKGNVIYAIEMAWPTDRRAVIHALGTEGLGRKIVEVKLLGSGSDLPFQQSAYSLRIQLPARPPGSYAYAYRIAVQN